MLFIPVNAPSGCFCRLWKIPDHMLTNTFQIRFSFLAAFPTTILNLPNFFCSTSASVWKIYFSSQLFDKHSPQREHVHMLQQCDQNWHISLLLMLFHNIPHGTQAKEKEKKNSIYAATSLTFCLRKAKRKTKQGGSVSTRAQSVSMGISIKGILEIGKAKHNKTVFRCWLSLSQITPKNILKCFNKFMQ